MGDVNYSEGNVDYSEGDVDYSEGDVDYSEGDVDYSVRDARGKFVDAGVSGIVELLPNGYVLKSPWPGRKEEECREDMEVEARAYQRLTQRYGSHKRFVKFIAFDDVDYSITMEHIPNGTLLEYLRVSGDRITQAQRYKWTLQLIHGVELMHSAGIVHCDLGPQNLLLDQDLELKIADFGCCSVDGGDSSAGGTTRYYPPRTSWTSPFTVNDDLFAMGSCIYEIWTGKAPYQDISSPCTRDLFKQRQFPDLCNVEMRDVIRDCWGLQAQSAGHIHRRVMAEMQTQA